MYLKTMHRRALFHSVSGWKRLFSTKDPLVLVSEVDGVRNLTMNSPKTRNSLSWDMLNSLLRQLEDTKDESLRCVVLRANGPVFSSGHNLKELAAGDYETRKETFSKCGELALKISSASVPIIAAVDGVAAAAGCQLAAACDIVVATERSQFSTPGANFGIFCSGPGVAVSRSVGRKASAKMLLTGLPVSAEEALRIGLVSAVCPNNELDITVSNFVAAIKHKSRAVIELGKSFFYKQLELDLPTAYREAAKLMADNLNMADGEEGLKSFVEKRKPVWQHKK